MSRANKIKEWIKSNRGWTVVIIVIGTIVIIGFVYEIRLELTSKETNTKSSLSAKYATLTCEDCKEQGVDINIWTNPDRSGIVTKAPHGTRVQILGTTIHDGIKYYKISLSGKTGYVRDWFIEGYSE